MTGLPRVRYQNLRPCIASKKISSGLNNHLNCFIKPLLYYRWLHRRTCTRSQLRLNRRILRTARSFLRSCNSIHEHGLPLVVLAVLPARGLFLEALATHARDTSLKTV